MRAVLAAAVLAASAGCATDGVVVVDPGYPAHQQVKVPPGKCCVSVARGSTGAALVRG
ncbi:MAG TPA: hypothetical protein VM489_09455 [Burkholderiales bacterium]|nr:hypothetical protein [Burkholderiales bacterium]